jgi:hypothetical protein
MAPMKRSSSTFQVAKATYLTEAALLRFSQVQHFLSQSGRCPFMAFASYAYIFSIHEEQIAPYTGQAVVRKGNGRTRRMPTITTDCVFHLA